jgi:hypothetical protein
MPPFALDGSVWFEWIKLSGCHVRVRTIQGKAHSGVLCALDPEAGSVMLLMLPAPGFLRLIMGHSVQSIVAEPENMSDEMAQAQTSLKVALDAKTSARESAGMSEMEAVDVIRVLRDMRIPADLVVNNDGEHINVMDGRARILAPYRPCDCQSSNETVLFRLKSVLSSQEFTRY